MVERYLKDKEKGTASEIRGLLNVSRKYAIPILEHLDSLGVTYRKGDFRYLVEK
jgi:selenocysteine-specific elongation factor